MYHLKQIVREHHRVMTSTQDRAQELMTALEVEKYYVVTADEQTKGRGTHGRSWFSPAYASLHATFVFPFPNHQEILLSHIPQVTAYAVLKTLKTYGLEAKFKWINDVLLDQKKICGILCESGRLVHLPGYHGVLVGIGINVNLDRNACDALDQPATSLMLALNKKMDIDDVLETLTIYFFEHINRLLAEGFGPFFKIISEKMAFIGERVRVQLDDDTQSMKEGLLVGIDAQGRLLLNSGNQIEKILTGRIIREKIEA